MSSKSSISLFPDPVFFKEILGETTLSNVFSENEAYLLELMEKLSEETNSQRNPSKKRNVAKSKNSASNQKILDLINADAQSQPTSSDNLNQDPGEDTNLKALTIEVNSIKSDLKNMADSLNSFAEHLYILQQVTFSHP